jgi:DNA-binding GntR family transcriptional regulator
MATLKALDRQPSLRDRAYNSLREYLRSGAIVGGQPLQEENLAALLGVSRTPVRDALTRLAGEGFLETDGRGFVVPLLTEQDVEDIYELRGMLEPEALRRVAGRIGDGNLLKPLYGTLAEMEAADAADDTPAFMDANYRYRAAWMALVPNAKLVRAIELYADHVRYLRSLTLDERHIRTVVLSGLRQVAKALAAGDGDATAAAMRAHLGEAKHFLLQALHHKNRGETERGATS